MNEISVRKMCFVHTLYKINRPVLNAQGMRIPKMKKKEKKLELCNSVECHKYAPNIKNYFSTFQITLPIKFTK